MATEARIQAGDQRFGGTWDCVWVNQSDGIRAARQVVVLGSPEGLGYASGDTSLELAQGNLSGMAAVSKFGENTDVDTALEDIWTGGGTWAAPTAARVHQITSSSANDTSAGTGARTIRVYGLTDWDTAEVNEDVIMNGTSNVATSNSYVIIHRMHILTCGTSGPNVGIITATADTDSTVTAEIAATDGQTLMAIYGVPSTKKLYMTDLYASVQKLTTASIDVRLLVNPIPGTEPSAYLVKTVFAVSNGGMAFGQRDFNPYVVYPGPTIIKVAGESSAVNASVSAGFDGVLVDN